MHNEWHLYTHTHTHTQTRFLQLLTLACVFSRETTAPTLSLHVANVSPPTAVIRWTFCFIRMMFYFRPASWKPTQLQGLSLNVMHSSVYYHECVTAGLQRLKSVLVSTLMPCHCCISFILSLCSSVIQLLTNLHWNFLFKSAAQRVSVLLLHRRHSFFPIHFLTSVFPHYHSSVVWLFLFCFVFSFFSPFLPPSVTLSVHSVSFSSYLFSFFSRKLKWKLSSSTQSHTWRSD